MEAQLQVVTYSTEEIGNSGHHSTFSDTEEHSNRHKAACTSHRKDLDKLAGEIRVLTKIFDPSRDESDKPEEHDDRRYYKPRTG